MHKSIQMEQYIKIFGRQISPRAFIIQPLTPESGTGGRDTFTPYLTSKMRTSTAQPSTVRVHRQRTPLNVRKLTPKLNTAPQRKPNNYQHRLMPKQLLSSPIQRFKIQQRKELRLSLPTEMVEFPHYHNRYAPLSVPSRQSYRYFKRTANPRALSSHPVVVQQPRVVLGFVDPQQKGEIYVAFQDDEETQLNFSGVRPRTASQSPNFPFNLNHMIKLMQDVKQQRTVNRQQPPHTNQFRHDEPRTVRNPPPIKRRNLVYCSYTQTTNTVPTDPGNQFAQEMNKLRLATPQTKRGQTNKRSLTNVMKEQIKEMEVFKKILLKNSPDRAVDKITLSDIV